MTELFPFDFPGPTTLYLVLYLVTLAVHVIFMSYVLGGSAYLAVGALFGRTDPESGLTVGDLIRDWLPFALGLAITAGVAPLLFLQILYPRNFYTANLLLSHRWMLILPVLIVGFYGLYLMKSGAAAERRKLRSSIALVSFACFLFVGLSWTENHLLSVDSKQWTSLYENRVMTYFSLDVLARFFVWLSGTLPIAATLIALQIERSERKGATIHPRAMRAPAMMGLGGLALSGAAAAVYVSSNPGAADVLASAPGIYLMLLFGGVLIQVVGWSVRLLQRRLLGLWAAVSGMLLMLVATTVLRELIRLDSIPIETLYAQHSRAAQIGGFWVFVLFATLSALAIAWIVRTTAGAE